MKVLSLFDGISCARVALERAGVQVDQYFASEIDKYAIEVSQKNYPDIIRLGSVTEVQYSPYGLICGKNTNNNTECTKANIDIMIGGSPCQDLSIAKNNRKGLAGERSSLFYEYLRILKETKPKFFILENVASMKKEDRDTITQELFGIEPIMINAALVSAQSRKRLFWVGKRVGETYEKVDIELPDDQHIYLKDILLSGETPDLKLLCITASYYKKNEQNYIEKRDGQMVYDEPHRIGDIGSNAQGHRVYSTQGKSVTLSANGGGQGAKTGLYYVDGQLAIREATKKGFALINEGDSVDISFPNSKTRRGRVGNKVKNLMTTQNITVFQGGVLRKLHPIECERLQSLPDNYTDGISNTQRYKTLGNAFNAEVVAHIIKMLK